MKTGLKKKEKFTHNSMLKRRLREYCGKFPESGHLIQEDEFGGAQYEIAKGRFSVRLTAPYSDERRKNASDHARKNKNAERLNGNADEKTQGYVKKVVTPVTVETPRTASGIADASCHRF